MPAKPARCSLYRQNLRAARRSGVQLSSRSTAQLRELSNSLHLSLASGEVMLLSGSWYVTHSGLLHIAQRRRCAGIHVDIQRELSDPAAIRWVAKAAVFRSANCKG